MFQEIRLAFAAFPNVGEPLFASVPDRQNIVLVGEDRDLAALEVAVVFQLDRVKNHEKGASVLFDFRPLMSSARVFDRELMQVELPTHDFEFVR